MSKLIVLPGHASWIAWRNEPGPLSAFVVTTGVGMHVGVAVGVGVAVAVAVAVTVGVTVAVGVAVTIGVTVGVAVAVAVGVGVGDDEQFGIKLEGGTFTAPVLPVS
jgi:hypothetical protein